MGGWPAVVGWPAVAARSDVAACPRALSPSGADDLGAVIVRRLDTFARRFRGERAARYAAAAETLRRRIDTLPIDDPEAVRLRRLMVVARNAEQVERDRQARGV